MTPFCANESALDREMNAIHRADRTNERIEARAAELVLPGGECDPDDADNLAEAITEADQPFWAQMSMARVAGDALQVDRLIGVETNKYWSKAAFVKAAQQIEQEDPPCGCIAGCRRCESEH